MTIKRVNINLDVLTGDAHKQPIMIPTETGVFVEYADVVAILEAAYEKHGVTGDDNGDGCVYDMYDEVRKQLVANKDEDLKPFEDMQKPIPCPDCVSVTDEAHICTRCWCTGGGGTIIGITLDRL